MKTSVALLILPLCYLCVAEDDPEGSGIDADNPVSKRGARCAGGAEFSGILKDMRTKLRKAQEQLNHLRGQIQGNKVAFGANLGINSNLGPFDKETTLIFKQVFVNTGAYNPDTGIFTAPVSGVYYFSMSGHNQSVKPMGLKLMKNKEHIISVFNHPLGNRWETATNGMTLELKRGDQVYVNLFPKTWIMDNDNNHSTFVGFLLHQL